MVIGDGPNRANLSELANELGVSHMVEFAGRTSDCEAYGALSRCDIFVMPSRLLKARSGEEGFGIVYLEAAAFGKAVVAGRSGGVPEAVLDGVTGILVDPEDPACVAEAIERLITDLVLRRRLGEAGRERVMREFAWSSRIEEMLSELG